LRAEKPYKRTERIENQILEIFGEIVTKHINLSHLGFVTFTKAQITTDFRHAKIFFSVIKPRIDIEDIIIGMNKLRGPFRKYLAPELHIKHIPELHFYYDESLEYTESIDKLINTIKNDN
jgi:ribosome-binding factor A